jgi:arsenate reductase
MSRPTGEAGEVRKRVVFVCVHNANRSQMAEAFARMYGGDAVEAFSAGSRPSRKVNPSAVASMRELCYDLAAHASKSLDDLPDVEWDAVVTMGCGDECPSLRARRRIDWNIPDPRDMPPDQFRRVRDQVEEHVRGLLKTLA